MIEVEQEEVTIARRVPQGEQPITPGPGRPGAGRPGAPPPADERKESRNPFAALGVSPPILRALRALGFREPTPIQRETIPYALAGRDLIGLAQTGSGKTAAFGIPLLQSVRPKGAGPQALVITPTRELCIQVTDELAALGKFTGVRLLAVVGGHDIDIQAAAIRHGVDIIVGTPGRLLDLLYGGHLDLKDVRYVVLDEADRMLDMGFIDDVRFILESVPPDHQTLLFSATMVPDVARIATEFLRDPVRIQIETTEATMPDIRQEYVTVTEGNRFETLLRILREEEIHQAIIFCRTRRRVDELVAQLERHQIAAQGLHGEMSQPERNWVMNAFRRRKLNILVATDVAARGIDVDDVSHVINYDAPDEMESYVHRIGRTGRAGRKGVAITLVLPRERRLIQLYEKHTNGSVVPRYPDEETRVGPSAVEGEKRKSKRRSRRRRRNTPRSNEPAG